MNVPLGAAPDPCNAGCDCNNESSPINRRIFLQLGGMSAAALFTARLPVMAGPFDTADFEKLVPSDKKLHPDWVKSLFERGVPQIYRDAETRFIGMPIGGIGAGQLYLGGDGKLWHWDIFNQHIGTGAAHYAKPLTPQSPVEQGFALQITANGQTTTRSLDNSGFADVAFRGEYPIGIVEYKDPASPVALTLEAFSPFIPLNTDDSSLPATVLQWTLKNTSSVPVEVTLSGWLQNAAVRQNQGFEGTRRNRIVREKGFTSLLCSVEKPTGAPPPTQPDIVFEDWNKDTYVGWTVEGTAFGSGPIKKTAIIDYQGDVGGDTERVVNTHSSARGNDVGARDANVGKLTSRRFSIERNFINLWIGGGAHKGKTCLNLMVDGKPVASITGRDNNAMSLQTLDVRAYKGKEAIIEIVDAETGPWGNIGVGKITFSDRAAQGGEMEQMPDYGTMSLALLGAPAEHTLASAEKGGFNGKAGNDATSPLSATLIGALGRKVRLAPNQTARVDFVLAWHFPNLEMQGMGKVGRYYATKFASAGDVARYISSNFTRLQTQTRLWRDTWYDSTLPYWFLDRTLLNASILATSTCYRFANGRFYAWEGVGCCPGTCVHVWHYAHSAARLFPALERDLRERVDYGIALDKDSGRIRFRGEHNNHWAVDAQAGTVLRVLREHQMSANSQFLQQLWPRVKKSLQFLIEKDAGADGIIDGPQHNTLDTDWQGEISWLSSLYAAALLAGAQMADETSDAPFAAQCRDLARKANQNITSRLFNGEYYYSRVDPAKPETINSGTGCEIDQVMGQSWAWQVGLPRVLPTKETKSALASLWKYNFSPDVGPYRAAHKPGRWYAMAGEAGLLMCTFPRNDWNYQKASGKGPDWAAGYFNECMNGFEYQVAGHMIWEGMVQEGLAITRAVHDRYHGSKRNPWNEVECGDHYARSMATHGVYLAACGYEYHGPQGHLSFAPRISPENFKAAFTTAEGWGSFAQQINGRNIRAQIELKYGQLRLRTISLEVPDGVLPKSVKASLGDNRLRASSRTQSNRFVLTFATEVVIKEGQKLQVEIA